MIIISPHDPARPGEENAWRFNFLGYEMEREGAGGGYVENVVRLTSQLMEIVGASRAGQGGHDPFWDRAAQRLVRNTVSLLSLAEQPITLDHISQAIASAPKDLAMAGGDKDAFDAWQPRSFCAFCLDVIDRRNAAGQLTSGQAHDFEMVQRFFLNSFPSLAIETRSSIVETLESITDLLLQGLAYELFSRDTTITPEVTFREGKIIILDLPILEYGAVAKIAAGIWKYMWQQAILRRDVKEYPTFAFLWADESANFVSSFDFLYQSVARSARACTVYLTQNINNYHAVLGSQAETMSFTGNLRTHIFHCNGDIQTNQFASDLIASDWMTTFGYNVNPGQGNVSGSGNQSVHAHVLPVTFTRLRQGGPLNHGEVDAILFKSGRLWSAGEAYIRTVFKQQL